MYSRPTRSEFQPARSAVVESPRRLQQFLVTTRVGYHYDAYDQETHTLVASGDLQADFAVFAQRLAGCRGRRPALAAPVQPLPSATEPTGTRP